MILFVIFPAIIIAVAGYNCPGGKLTSLEREQTVTQINKFRSQLANGKLKNKDRGLMPKSKNMMEMRWSCKLENSAQNWADQCALRHSSENQRVEIGENINGFRSSRSVEVFNASAAMHPVEWWWSQLTKSYRNNPSNTLTPDVYSHGQDVLYFTQLAWGKTDKVGCGVAMHCDGGNALFVVCHFAPRRELIYERGIPCKADKHCRTKRCSRESGLCRK
uniref:SCP domain-containing protein n=1 Tax=Onchocerca volvulus TaxID=6282 RepID=A0A8R1U1H0_ONCVO